MRDPAQSTAVAVATPTFDESYAALGRGDYPTALKGFRTLAERGDADAQSHLGVMYAAGRGVSQNDAEAVRWYRKAADQGNAFAQSNLGVMYVDGRGISQSDAEAVRWFRKAAEQGNAEARKVPASCITSRRNLHTPSIPRDRIGLQIHSPSRCAQQRQRRLSGVRFIVTRCEDDARTPIGPKSPSIHATSEPFHKRFMHH